MAATDTAFYYNGLKNLGQAQFNWITPGGSSIKAILLKDSYVFNGAAQDGHDFLDDIVAHRADGQGDLSLTLANPSNNTTSSWALFDATNDLTFPSVDDSGGQVLVGVAIYKEDGAGDAASELLTYHGFGSSVSANGGDIVVQFSADGVFTLSYANVA